MKMMVKDGFQRAEREPLYIIDGLNYVRTEPTPNGAEPYAGFIKTTIGERQISIQATPIFEGLLSGQEITKIEYDAHTFDCGHSWRVAWLKNSNVKRKVTFCTLCGEYKQ